MENKTKKIEEAANALSDVVKEAGGCLMVIGQVPVEGGTEIIAKLRGKHQDIVVAGAHVLVQENAAPFREIFKNAMTIREILRLTGRDKADFEQITERDDENEENNEDK